MSLGVFLSAVFALSLQAPSVKNLRDLPTFSVTADRLQAEPERGRYRAEGNVILRRAGAVLFADRVTFDEARQVAVAEGNVTAIEGRTVLTCQRVEMRLPELFGGLQRGELRIKSALPPELLRSEEKRSFRHYGRDELILSAGEISRTGDRSFELSDGSFTPCDCGDATPSWSISAVDASVDLDSGASLSWPVFRVLDVPVMALPYFYIPLGSRRTGLLLPRPSFSSVRGLTVTQPFYLVLGRSWDATLEGTILQRRGFASALELRWAPSRNTRGEVKGTVFFDRGELDSDGDYYWSNNTIVRHAVSGRHDTRFGGGQRLVAELNLLGDPSYLSDFEDEYLNRQAEYSQSRITYTQASDEVRFAGGVMVLSDLRSFTYGQTALREATYYSDAARSIRYRLAELRLDALPHSLVSTEPVSLLGNARLTVSALGARDPNVARFLRVDLRPEVRAPIDLRVLTLEPALALRFGGWAGSVSGGSSSATRIALIGKARLFTELSRVYGGDWVHRILPELSYVVIPVVRSADVSPFWTNDEVDQLAEVSQVRGRLRTELWRGSQERLGIEGWIGRDLGIGGHPGRGTSELMLAMDALLLSPSYNRAGVRFDGWASVDLEQRDLMALMAGLHCFDARGDSIGVWYGHLDDRISTHSFIAPEELVPSHTITSLFVDPTDPRVATGEAMPWSRLRGLVVSAKVQPLEQLQIVTSLTLDLDDESIIRNTRTRITWDSSCDCWNASLTISTAPDRDFPDVGFVLDLARLGGTEQTEQR